MGCGGVLGQGHRQLLHDMGRVIVFDSSTILGVDILLLRICFQICLIVFFLKKLGFLIW